MKSGQFSNDEKAGSREGRRAIAKERKELFVLLFVDFYANDKELITNR